MRGTRPPASVGKSRVAIHLLEIWCFPMPFADVPAPTLIDDVMYDLAMHVG
jgi:hypothetical protein